MRRKVGYFYLQIRHWRIPIPWFVYEVMKYTGDLRWQWHSKRRSWE